MKKKVIVNFSYILAGIGLIASGASSIGCMLFFVDEPVMPVCMIEE